MLGYCYCYGNKEIGFNYARLFNLMFNDVVFVIVDIVN